MKKHILSLLAITSALSAKAGMPAGPTNPMDNYTPSNHQEYEVARFWRSMRTDLKGKDCYRRAHLWSYELNRQYGVKSTKIFIHYTNRFNRELDNLGRKRGLGWLARKTWDAPGVTSRTRSLVRSNITWDYHVAPMIDVGDKKIVLDRYLALPYDAPTLYTEREAWSLEARPATAEEWVEALTVRGELLWQARKQELIKEMNEKLLKANREHSDRKRARLRREFEEARKNYIRLGMDKKDRIDIKCKKIDSIVELDKNHDTAWCFYSEAPMYYYNEIDLRYLAYGDTGLRYSMAPPASVQTERNYINGRRYIQSQWNEEELEDAVREIKIEME